MQRRESEGHTVTEWTEWRALAPRGIAAVVLMLSAAMFWKLALAPVHGVADVAACERAYADARTHQDSVSVDFLSYPDPQGRAITQRCGFRPSATANSVADSLLHRSGAANAHSDRHVVPSPPDVLESATTR